MARGRKNDFSIDEKSCVQQPGGWSFCMLSEFGGWKSGGAICSGDKIDFLDEIISRAISRLLLAR